MTTIHIVGNTAVLSLAAYGTWMLIGQAHALLAAVKTWLSAKLAAASKKV